ncbi:porin family protein [Flavobacterium capsici]|uniref:Porin family protein n=1 Tax=Flavobacterium capsici TaxID=3075618 RepID=A0AA96EZJ9_9FLAO|nr:MULTISPECIES: porin family protein [unclassified Flavobacterium]WNM18380.1 porin family protein [Flavobacterium sp. PMR2A8]WNM22431.1 porin family protein [Flavobacterium sp. PMTSA4]
MKKIACFVLVAFGLSLNMVAQKKGDIEAGFNIGYNSSSVSDSRNTSDSGNGFNIGGSLDFYLSNTWSIKTKLIYDQKGWNNDVYYDANSGNQYATDYNLNYLTVPVMANWHFGNTRNWYLNFGPYVGFLLNAKDARFNNDVTDFFNNTDFGLAFGVGVKIPVSDKVKLFFEFEGQGGFTDILKYQNNYDYSAVTNSRGSFNFGVNFLLK